MTDIKVWYASRGDTLVNELVVVSLSLIHDLDPNAMLELMVTTSKQRACCCANHSGCNEEVVVVLGV